MGGKKSELTKWERHLEVQVRNQQFFEKRVGNLRVSSHWFLVGVRFSSSKFDFQHFFFNGGWLPGVKGNVHLVFSWKIWKSEFFVTSEWNLGKFQKKNIRWRPMKCWTPFSYLARWWFLKTFWIVWFNHQLDRIYFSFSFGPMFQKLRSDITESHSNWSLNFI